MKYPTDPLRTIANGGVKKMVRDRPAVIRELQLDGYIQADEHSDSYHLTSHGTRALNKAA